MARRRTSYETFDGARVEREVWLGRRVALLPDQVSLDEPTVARILEALDRAADFYADLTGREPKPRGSIDGRITIAEVSGIGGAAWAWLGETGIEIQPEYLDVLVRGVREHGVFDQPLFYELGRNYWHYEGLLDMHPGTVATGYAVAMRFFAMDAAGVRGAPYRDWPFEEFRGAVTRLLDAFVAAREHDWVEILAQTPIPLHTFERPGSGPLTLSSADLVASLFVRLASLHGGVPFLGRLFHGAEALPRLRSHHGICENLLRAACAAADADLSPELAAWRWPARLPIA